MVFTKNQIKLLSTKRINKNPFTGFYNPEYFNKYISGGNPHDKDVKIAPFEETEFVNRSLFTFIDFSENFETPDKEEVAKIELQRSEEEILEDWIKNFYVQLAFSDQTFNIEWFENKFKIDKDRAKTLLTNEFSKLLRSQETEETRMVNLLNLMADYSYEEMLPIGPIILTSAISAKSDRVKEAVMRIFGLWANKEIYHILRKLESPKGFLYRIQFESLLRSFEQKYALPEKDKDRSMAG